MDEFEFLQVLELFPVVRSRDYHADLDSSRQLTQSTTSFSKNDNHEAFLGKLKLAAEKKAIPIISLFETALKYTRIYCGFLTICRLFTCLLSSKVGAADAEIFCKAFQQVYKKLVYEELSLDAAQRFIYS